MLNHTSSAETLWTIIKFHAISLTLGLLIGICSVAVLFLFRFSSSLLLDHESTQIRVELLTFLFQKKKCGRPSHMVHKEMQAQNLNTKDALCLHVFYICISKQNFWFTFLCKWIKSKINKLSKSMLNDGVW